MRKRIIIAGPSREGLELVPLLEANPALEICAIVTDDPAGTASELARIDSAAARRLADRITSDAATALAVPGLHAVIDADAPRAVRERLAATRELQLTPPALARLLFAYGPADAFSKPDLLHALREMMDSADLTRDRRSVLDLVLQVAVTATGADRGSLMLWDERDRALRVEVALGIEDELIEKIRVQSGEGIAGRAFAAERAIMIHGKADRAHWQIVRERDDVESAISAPLVHGERVLGVLNLSHARKQHQFTDADLDFVEQLARLDARIIARAEEYHGLVQESEALRVERQVHRLLARTEPLALRLQSVCGLLAEPLRSGVAQLWLRESGSETLVLQAASTRLDPLALRERIHLGEGVAGRAAKALRSVWLSGRRPDADLCLGAVPLIADDDLLGVLSLQGERDPASPDPAERTAAAATALAGELSAALRATRLERESARAERLGDAVSALGACKEPRELWEAITTWAVSLLEAESAILRLVDESTGRLRIVAWNGVGQWQRSAVAELERKLSNEAMTTQRLIRVADLQTDPSFAFLAVGVSTAMTQALMRDGETLGSLTVLGKVPQDPLLGERFDPSDEPVLERLSQHAVGALLAFRQPERPDVDSVTGLPKRAPLRERLGGELARSRTRGHALALLELHFDGLDDTPAPDALAIELAHGLREALREFDLLCRPESDRFAVLVPEPDQDVTRVISELCRQAREVLDVHEDDATGVELRVGYAVFPQDGDTPEALEARASDCRVVPA